MLKLPCADRIADDIAARIGETPTLTEYDDHLAGTWRELHLKPRKALKPRSLITQPIRRDLLTMNRTIRTIGPLGRPR